MFGLEELRIAVTAGRVERWLDHAEIISTNRHFFTPEKYLVEPLLDSPGSISDTRCRSVS